MKSSVDTGLDRKIEPCDHMVDNISALADGSLQGIARWYTRFHASYCPRCRKALEALRAITGRLRRLAGFKSGTADSMPVERRESLKSELDRMDSSG